MLLSGFGKAEQIDHKGAVDLVTEYDRAAEEAIVNVIRARHPDHAIVAEEGHGAEGRSPWRWFVDPLDGTTNYAHGYPCFSVSIAAEHAGQTVLGVVHDPLHKEAFTAVRGEGALLNGNPIRVSRTDELSESLLATGFPYDVRVHKDNNLNHFGSFVVRAQAVRRDGSAALDLCYVAAGRFDGFWELKLAPWDVAAGTLIVLEAGGRITDFSGESEEIDGREIVASNGLIHDAMLSVLAAGQAGE
ncbi:histidinol phosphate phosphatase [candidate division TA06 bacterium DG_24]|uniref:Inositol-1-monophosphatase n=3 Tax=Bacteria division TA06 TaxID=1156500 RepID=A0A0S8JMU9_UNCT6|nr:MAG: histidinol phosphate phosphatase [candidate division TA06 bacterium DG_24]KPK70664.1 MAG: histidinol phosphate phosphatase [candidate division TA06 bacterium SM23_40]KPL10952.1 MAG: histidinol phosphate phosphatase [candidate division TA06 bacterium SM1_40]